MSNALILRKLDILERKLEEMKAQPEFAISEEEACKLLGISLKTMQNYICEGKLVGTWDKDALGRRVFFKSKLIPFIKSAS